MAPRKIDLALAVRTAITALDDLVARMNELDDIFISSEYDSEGSNPITDEELAGHDLTAQNLAAVHTFVTQINLFLNDGTPMQFDYASAINKLRNMPGG